MSIEKLKGIYFNACCENEEPATCLARKNALSEVQLCLKAGINVNLQDEFGYTGLMLAVAEENEEIVKFLIDSNTDTTIKSSMGRTALTLVRDKNSEIYRMVKKAYEKQIYEQSKKLLQEIELPASPFKILDIQLELSNGCKFVGNVANGKAVSGELQVEGFDIFFFCL